MIFAIVEIRVECRTLATEFLPAQTVRSLDDGRAGIKITGGLVPGRLSAELPQMLRDRFQS